MGQSKKGGSGGHKLKNLEGRNVPTHIIDISSSFKKKELSGVLQG